MNNTFNYNRIVLILLSVYTIIQVYCINQLTPNYDEGSFASYGITILKLQGKKDIRRYDSKLPITAVNMLPRAVEQVFSPSLAKIENANEDVERGRYISLLVSLLLGLLLFKWARELYDKRTALFCLALYLLCPNFLAHGLFVSSDIFACFFMTLVFYNLWRYKSAQKFKYFLYVSIAAGFAQISKFSMAHLFVIVPLVSLIASAYTPGIKSRFNFKRFFYLSFIFLFTSWFMINAAHFFYQTFLPVNNYEFLSTLFKQLQHILSGINIPVPFPFPSSYIGSMDMVLYAEELGGGQTGSLNGTPYILGEHRTQGFWYYYFVTIFFKLPIPVLLIWLGSFILLFKQFTKTSFFRNDIFLLVPVIYFLVYFNFFYSTQIGIRHIIIIFPLFYIFSGKLIHWLIEKKKQYVLYILIAIQAISVLRYFPHFLPYTNEFILNKKMTYKKIADTNLCYGEGQKYLWKYLSKNKEMILSPEKPVSGKIVVDVNEMLNLNVRTAGRYEWMWSLTPVDHIHSQYLVFDVSQAFIDSLKK